MQAIGFDLGETLICYDGVPLSWQAHYPAALTHMAQAFGVSATAEKLQTGAEILARYNTRLFPRLAEVSSDEILGEVLHRWHAYSESNLQVGTRAFFAFFQRTAMPYPETLAVLQALRQHGIKIGILTDVPYGMGREFVQADLRATGVDAYVDVLLTSVEVGYRKPAPEGYLRLAAALGVQPCDLVYVGNEEKDILGANAAGVFSVWVDRSGQKAGYGEKRRIESLLELVP